MTEKSKWLEFGINPSRFVGARYSTSCKALAKIKNDHRPMITVHLVWIVAWVKMPWHHSDDRQGYTIGKSWGAVMSLRLPFRNPLLYWGD